MTLEMFALLTRIRIPGATMDLRKVARQQQFFPLVGLVVGLSAVIAAMFLDSVLGPRMFLVSGGLVIVLLYYINGILHTEGMADFADGLMASGDHDRKTNAMKDVHCGVGGVFAVVIYLVLMFALVSRLCMSAEDTLALPWLPWGVSVVVGFAIAEMGGKLALLTAIRIGPSAHPGMGQAFVEEAGLKRLLVAIVIAGSAAFLISGLFFPIVFVGMSGGLWVALKARKNFGGVSGDAFGAANEIGRLLTLLAWVLVI